MFLDITVFLIEPTIYTELLSLMNVVSNPIPIATQCVHITIIPRLMNYFAHLN